MHLTKYPRYGLTHVLRMRKMVRLRRSISTQMRMRTDAKVDAHPQSAQHDPAHAHASVHARCIPHTISKLSAGALSGWPVHLVLDVFEIDQ